MLQTENPFIGVTQHMVKDGIGYITAINCSDKPRKPDFRVQEGWNYKVLYGNENEIPACDGVALQIQKNNAKA